MTNSETATPYVAVYRAAKYWPETIIGTDAEVTAQIAGILDARNIPPADTRLEGYTDQIDVYIRNRKVAVYMAGG